MRRACLFLLFVFSTWYILSKRQKRSLCHPCHHPTFNQYPRRSFGQSRIWSKTRQTSFGSRLLLRYKILTLQSGISPLNFIASKISQQLLTVVRQVRFPIYKVIMVKSADKLVNKKIVVVGGTSGYVLLVRVGLQTRPLLRSEHRSIKCLHSHTTSIIKYRLNELLSGLASEQHKHS